MAKRTVLRSSRGKKLYAVRDKGGKFKDIQSYARAHAADLRSTSKAEAAAGMKKKAKKKAKKKSAKRGTAKVGKAAGKKAGKKKTARRTTKKSARKAAKR
jgi:hypothetical protein